MVPKKVKQINDHLFIDTYKSNNIKIGLNDVTVNDSEMCVRCVERKLTESSKENEQLPPIYYCYRHSNDKRRPTAGQTSLACM